MGFRYARRELPFKHRVFLALHQYLPCNTPGFFSANKVTARNSPTLVRFESKFATERRKDSDSCVTRLRRSSIFSLADFEAFSLADFEAELVVARPAQPSVWPEEPSERCERRRLTLYVSSCGGALKASENPDVYGRQ